MVTNEIIPTDLNALGRILKSDGVCLMHRPKWERSAEIILVEDSTAPGCYYSVLVKGQESSMTLTTLAADTKFILSDGRTVGMPAVQIADACVEANAGLLQAAVDRAAPSKEVRCGACHGRGWIPSAVHPLWPSELNSKLVCVLCAGSGKLSQKE